MRNILRLFIIVLAAASLALFSGCEEKGPAEKAGEQVDEAVEETEEEARQAKEDIEDAAGN